MSVTEGEHAGDAGAPGRYICQLTAARLEPAHPAMRHSRRSTTRALSREVLPGVAGGTSAG